MASPATVKGALQLTVDIETGAQRTVTDSPTRGLVLERYKVFARNAEEERDSAATAPAARQHPLMAIAVSRKGLSWPSCDPWLPTPRRQNWLS